MTALAAYIAMAIGAAGLYLIMPGGAQRLRLAGLLLLFAGMAGLVGVFASLRHQAETPESANFLFYLFSAITLIAAVRVITHNRPVYAVLYFVVVVLASAGLVLLAGAQFLAAALIVIYAGAIVVTYAFVIMLARQGGEEACDSQSREPLAAIVLGFVLCATITGASLRPWPSAGDLPRSYGPEIAKAIGEQNKLIEGQGHVAQIGMTLVTDFAVALEVAGLLLLVAMVGAVVIATKRTDESPSSAEEGGGA